MMIFQVQKLLIFNLAVFVIAGIVSPTQTAFTKKLEETLENNTGNSTTYTTKGYSVNQTTTTKSVRLNVSTVALNSSTYALLATQARTTSTATTTNTAIRTQGKLTTVFSTVPTAHIRLVTSAALRQTTKSRQSPMAKKRAQPAPKSSPGKLKPTTTNVNVTEDFQQEEEKPAINITIVVVATIVPVVVMAGLTMIVYLCMKYRNQITTPKEPLSNEINRAQPQADMTLQPIETQYLVNGLYIKRPMNQTVLYPQSTLYKETSGIKYYRPSGDYETIDIQDVPYLEPNRSPPNIQLNRRHVYETPLPPTPHQEKESYTQLPPS